MQIHEFYARTRDIGPFDDAAAAKDAVAATLHLLARRLPAEEAKDLAAQLPEELKIFFADSPTAKNIDKLHASAFFAAVGEQIGKDAQEGKRAAVAVAQVLCEAVSVGQVRHVWQMMPGDLRALFES